MTSASCLREQRRWKLGIEHLIMLTGDNQATAEAIARQTGIDEFQAELLPADKVAAVERLVEKYGSVAMTGDGLNDAPVPCRATLGIVMGAIGSDAAIETADIALMSDDVSRLRGSFDILDVPCGNHPAEHLRIARRQGCLRGAHASRLRLAMGSNRRLYGCVAPCDCQRITAA